MQSKGELGNSGSPDLNSQHKQHCEVWFSGLPWPFLPNMHSFLLSSSIHRQAVTHNPVIQPPIYPHPGSGPSFRRLNTCRGFSRYWNFQSTLCGEKGKLMEGMGILYATLFWRGAQNLSSPTIDGIPAPAVDAQSLNRWASKEVPTLPTLNVP